MKNRTEKKFVFPYYDRTIIIRPFERSDLLAPRLTRIVVGDTIHSICGINKPEPLIALCYIPQQKRPTCLYCKKHNWSAWMPIPFHAQDLGENDDVKGEIRATWWCILCMYCRRMLKDSEVLPYDTVVTEYAFQPHEDRPFWKRRHDPWTQPY